MPLNRYRLLIVVVLLACGAALVELAASSSPAARKPEELPYVMLELYPESSDINYVLGRQQAADENLNAARACFERALKTGDRTNEDLLYHYALTLARLRCDPREVAAAVDQWRYHFPHSRRPDPRGEHPTSAISAPGR